MYLSFVQDIHVYIYINKICKYMFELKSWFKTIMNSNIQTLIRSMINIRLQPGSKHWYFTENNKTADE